MNIYFFILLFMTTVDAFSSEIVWESNVAVRKIETKCVNTFVTSPLKINLNSADKTALINLSGVGPIKADAIIEYRTLHGPFKTVKDLGKVKGFTKKVLAKIIEQNKDLLVVSPVQ